MIGHTVNPTSITPLGITEQMRDAAKNRAGEWEVTTYDWDVETPGFGYFGGIYRFGMRLCGRFDKGKTLQKTTIRLGEKEIPRILHIVTHGYRNKTKVETIHANLEQVAETLWPSGSLEHVSMRFLAVPVLTRVVMGHQVTVSEVGRARICSAPFFITGMVLACRRLWSSYETTSRGIIDPGPVTRYLPAFCGLAALGCFIPQLSRYKTQLLRCDDHSRGTLNHGDENDAVSRDANGKKGSGDDAPPTDPKDKPDVFKHGGNTPEDAHILANEQDRFVNLNGIKMIVGQDFDGVDLDTKQIVGVLTAPTPKMPNVYNNSSANARAAKRERLDKKARPYTGTKADQKKIGKLVGEACGTKSNRAIFSEKRIKKWAEETFHMEDIKSGKWSNKRLEDSLTNLFKQAYPKMNLKCQVKLEPMQEGKPPRLLIADGDDGQLMALVVVKCFEDLLFEWFEDKSIKHASKRKAVKRTVKNLTKKGARLIEGDGSAWDTTNNASIRSQVENPVLRHIMQVLTPYGVVPAQWHEEHLKCCEKKQLKLFFQKNMDKMRMTIDAIRRSGHRGTSCLNWWENFVNWICSIFQEPERFLDPTVRKGIDETGHERWWNGCFEGDDSLCAMYPPMNEGDLMDEIFLGWWKRQGFNMTIVYADRRATFCGYHIACVDGEPSGFVCPELPRALVGAGVSCSSTIIEAAKCCDVGSVRDIAAAGALARAADFAGLLPTVSRKFHQYANSVKRSTEVIDREMSMRVMGEEGHNFTAIEESIESQNLSVTPTEEAANLEALLCPATLKELDTFMLHPWTFESIGDFEAHRASLPVSWRPPQK